MRRENASPSATTPNPFKCCAKAAFRLRKCSRHPNSNARIGRKIWPTDAGCGHDQHHETPNSKHLRHSLCVLANRLRERKTASKSRLGAFFQGGRRRGNNRGGG